MRMRPARASGSAAGSAPRELRSTAPAAQDRADVAGEDQERIVGHGEDSRDRVEREHQVGGLGRDQREKEGASWSDDPWRTKKWWPSMVLVMEAFRATQRTTALSAGSASCSSLWKRIFQRCRPGSRRIPRSPSGTGAPTRPRRGSAYRAAGSPEDAPERTRCWCRGGIAKLRNSRTNTNRLSTESDFSSRYPAKYSSPCSPPYRNQTKKPNPTERTIQNTLHQTASLNVELWSRRRS